MSNSHISGQGCLDLLGEWSAENAGRGLRTKDSILLRCLPLEATEAGGSNLIGRTTIPAHKERQNDISSLVGTVFFGKY